MRGNRGTRGRGGFALAEAIVAGTLALLVTQVAWWVVAVQSVVASRVVQEAQILDEARLVRHLLGTEVGQGRGGVDWFLAGDTLHLRGFRGVALACQGQGSEGWAATLSGFRVPDPAKDSAVVLTASGRWEVSRIVRRRSASGSACRPPAGFSAEALVLDPPRPGAVAALWFERGAYRFSGSTLRYRPGRAGWQPVTTASIDTDSTRLGAEDPNVLEVRSWWKSGADSLRTQSWTNRGLER